MRHLYVCNMSSRVVLGVIQSFILQSRAHFLLKYEMTVIDLMNLGQTLTDFRKDEQCFILMRDIFDI